MPEPALKKVEPTEPTAEPPIAMLPWDCLVLIFEKLSYFDQAALALATGTMRFWRAPFPIH